MGALFGTIIKVVLQVLAGVGIGKVMDKVAADKVPGYESSTADLLPGTKTFKPIKLLFLIISFVLGYILLKFVGKKFKIHILK